MRKQKRKTIKLGEGGAAQILELHVTCDWCVNQQKERPAAFVTRATGTLSDDGARKGWRIGPTGIDVCPQCLREAGEPPVLKLEPRQGELFD